MGLARAAVGVAAVKHHKDKKEDKKEAKQQAKQEKKQAKRDLAICRGAMLF